MACATLKRSLDFDPVHTNPRKRQRCSPMSPMYTSPNSSPNDRTENNTPSVFTGVCPELTPETMARKVRDEICRLYRKKQLHFHPKLDGSDSPSDFSLSSVNSLFSAAMRDKPLFTFRQVGLICERLINERENQIREEYDRFLNSKLSEQYEAFVKFSNDQLQRCIDFGSTPSYLS